MLSFICQPCRTAGALHREPGETSLVVNRRRQQWHSQCRGGTWCDCQHRLPRTL